MAECRGERMIYVNRFGMLKIADESDDLFGEIPEETIDFLDNRKPSEI
jgi:hypothetical protein